MPESLNAHPRRPRLAPHRWDSALPKKVVATRMAPTPLRHNLRNPRRSRRTCPNAGEGATTLRQSSAEHNRNNAPTSQGAKAPVVSLRGRASKAYFPCFFPHHVATRLRPLRASTGAVRACAVEATAAGHFAFALLVLP